VSVSLAFDDAALERRMNVLNDQLVPKPSDQLAARPALAIAIAAAPAWSHHQATLPGL
jgi:hypothetical protein